MLRTKSKIAVFLLLTLVGCSSFYTNTEFYQPILSSLKQGDYNQAVQKVFEAEIEDEYADKDKLLLHLDKAMLLHYQGNYQQSNNEFDKAERIIEELYTKSISKAAASMLANDNALDYSGEVYENLYINIFKALNYINMNMFDEAFVEANRVNVKLREYDLYYEEMISDLNSSEDAKIEIDSTQLDYYNNVLANYISHIIYRADGEYDNSRIALEKLNDAWVTYKDVYNFEKPQAVKETTSERMTFLNVLAFAGNGPDKKPIGARITTFDGFVTISDPTNFYVDAIPFPGIKYGWNFKFEFPTIEEEGTEVYDIEVYIDSTYYGKLELLENMMSVAKKTFETQKSITYFKTITRAVLKGVSSSAAGRTLKKEIGSEGVGNIAAGLLNLIVDASEHADLRSWRTMPGYCFVGEYDIDPGIYNIEIRFIGEDNKILSKRTYKDFRVKKGLNLVEAYHLN